ncbi:hypothetical protein PLESTB_000101200 [Pleodorina starrii]|uniref:RNA-binding S4 domain-containing protein n=1 Tax=Pleodorina starrii TaxID=330485 RepID=A0A9W6BAH3_9CHLO|nr:hypothetical protein PLESTM_000097700 [Pleodorina starrii]GLC48468.1 hypothetical protein PLESTB_000101200 [Pleodorina starrii]GLC71788.1 hypothetical protein PLESTF_001167000 [Pleodorina starrii]
MKTWRSQARVGLPRVCCCRPRRFAASAHCGKARPQAVATSADGSLPSFTFRVTAKQAASSKLRLDIFLAAQIAADLAAAPPGSQAQDVSRAKIQASISGGLVRVNGRPASKASQQLKAGDCVECVLPPPPPVQAVPEAIPLDIKYEDEHVIVVNKPAGMVVHVAPGHYTGTLVNALLHHCALPAMDLDPDLDLDLDLDLERNHGGGSGGTRENGDGDGDLDDDDDLGEGDDDGDGDGDGSDPGGSDRAQRGGGEGGGGARRLGRLGTGSSASSSGAGGGGGGGGGVGLGVGGGCLRPGIVHRLDKGTSGLLVVAKTEVALTRLQAQFKARTVDRLYDSITVGCPAQRQGRVETNIVRDPRDRKRMAAAPYGSGRGRTAGSGYTVVTPLAGGGAALVRWKLDTGRTHQIRVHARHLGHPLLGDATYGGTASTALAAVARSFPSDAVRRCVEHLGRPALHARTLGFEHPTSGQRLAFEQPPPEDFLRALQQLGWEPGAGAEVEAGRG